MQDDFIETIAKGNIDAFLSDLRADPQQKDLEKSLREHRQSEDVDHQINSFFEDLELRAAGGRTGPAPRLRTEHQESEPEMIWRPGDPIEAGLEDGGDLQKRHGGKLREPARVEKSTNGWTTEYDENDSVIRVYGPGVSREVFARL